MAPQSTELAITGSAPKGMPVMNTFDFLFSNPFRRPNSFTPVAQTVSRIDPAKAIFTDHKTNKTLTYDILHQTSLAISQTLFQNPFDLMPYDTVSLPPTPSCPAGPQLAPIVLIQLPNCLAFPPLLLGVLAAGLTATLVSPALTPTEVSWILGNSRPRIVIIAKSCLKGMMQALRAEEDQQFFGRVQVFAVDVEAETFPEIGAKEAKFEKGVRDWKALLKPNRPNVPRVDPFPPAQAKSRTAVILWSSGTSGRSKGVLLSHHALNFSIAHLWHDSPFLAPDFAPQNKNGQRFLGYVPFYHIYGLVNILLLAVPTASTTFTLQSFSLPVMLDAIPQRKITFLHLAPPVVVMLAKSPLVEPYAKRGADGKNAFSSIIAGVTGGAPCGWEVIESVFERCGFRVRMGYGLSEACSVTVQRGVGRQEMVDQRGDSGKAHWGVELMIASPDSMASPQPSPAALSQEGEILIRAPGLMSAYLPLNTLLPFFPREKLDMDATQSALTSQGWLRTGDVGTLDAKGQLRITDRLKELIKVRGFQVAPAELEALLCSSERVADAGVVGVHDEDEASEFPRAFVVPSGDAPSEEEMWALATELKGLVEGKTARYKWLHGGIVFVKQIPKSPSGKILRRVLKDGKVEGFKVDLYEKKRRHAKL